MQLFKGIKQVLASTYNATQPADKVGYLWFVRKSTEATEGQIYLGSRLYGAGSVEVITNLTTKIDNINNAVGLDENGEYLGSDSAYTIIAESNSVQEALEKLDAYGRKLTEDAATTLTYENGVLKLLSKKGDELTTVNLPKEQFLRSAELVTDPAGMEPGKYLKMVFAIEGSEDSTVYVAVSDLVDVYTAGGGIKIENNVVSINDECLTMIQYSDSEVRRLETAKVSWAYDQKTQTNINILIPVGGSVLGNYGDENAVLVKGGLYELEDGTMFKQTEVGSSKIHLNLNSSDRPTVEGTSGKEEIAYLSDLEKGFTVETPTADTVAAGHIEFVQGENGWYGQMYYDGDDVEA